MLFKSRKRAEAYWNVTPIGTDITMVDVADMNIYVCQYCGSTYVSDKKGFIPSCQCCGGKMVKE